MGDAWFGIIGGGVVGLALTVLGIIFTEPIQVFVGNRVGAVKERQKARAIAEYRLMSELREGEKDKVSYLAEINIRYITLQTSAIGFLAILAVFLVGLAIVLAIIPGPIFASDHPSLMFILAGTVVVYIFEIILLAAAIRSYLRIRRITFILFNFERYEAEHLKRFPPPRQPGYFGWEPPKDSY